MSDDNHEIAVTWTLELADPEEMPDIPSNATNEEKALILAKHVQERCFQEGEQWTFVVSIGDREYVVDLLEETVEELDESDGSTCCPTRH